MATLDIFNNDAFSMASLIQTITDVPFVPTQLGDEGLFTESGMNTTVAMIERQGSKLQLVPTAPRGGVPQPGTRSGRKLIPIAAVHLPQSDTIQADEVQGIRAFGSETEVQAVQTVVRNRLVALRANQDLTMEFQRIGALKGIVYDADGSTELLNMYTLFGFTQDTVFFDLSNANADIRQKCADLSRKIQDAMGGRPTGPIKVKVSRTFFDKLTSHAKVLKAFDLYQQGAFLRQDMTQGVFVFAGIEFRVYHGGTSAGNFIADDLGYAYPTGVPNMFKIVYAPANFIETVNTNGLPFYAKQKVNDWGTGVDLYVQSNPLTYNSQPEAVIKVSAAAS